MNKEKYWQEIVNGYKVSGLNAKQFSKAQGIGESTLKRYCKKFSEESKDISNSAVVFESIVLNEPLVANEVERKVVVCLPNSIRSEIDVQDNQGTVALLKELMQLC